MGASLSPKMVMLIAGVSQATIRPVLVLQLTLLMPLLLTTLLSGESNWCIVAQEDSLGCWPRCTSRPKRRDYESFRSDEALRTVVYESCFEIFRIRPAIES